MKRAFTIFSILLVISGCSTVRTAIAMMQTTDNFTLYSERNGLLFQEVDPSPLAMGAEKYLSEAIAVVEMEQYRKFAKPIKIYAVSTLHNLRKYCGYKDVLGCVVNEKLFLSPRILTQPEGTLPRLLTHELSHLHIAQQLSLLQRANVPTWFREGLAVYVSTRNDASAKLDFKEAKTKISQGKAFYPNEEGSLFFQKDNASFHLSRRLFYREAASFVQFLHDADSTGFRDLLLSIQDKQAFSSSFQKCYGVTVDAKWKEFVEQERINHMRTDSQQNRLFSASLLAAQEHRRW